MWGLSAQWRWCIQLHKISASGDGALVALFADPACPVLGGLVVRMLVFDVASMCDVTLDPALFTQAFKGVVYNWLAYGGGGSTLCTCSLGV